MYSTGARPLLGALLAGLALLAAGCGGGAGEPETVRAATEEAARSQPRAADPRCLNQLGGFLGSLDRLRDQLVAGVTYEQYVEELSDVRAAYSRLPVNEIELRCLRRVGSTGERALNRYIDAAEIWSDCVELAGCQSASIEARLQRRWRQGSRLLSRAEDGISTG